jgi:hypothetical protein
MTSRSKSRKWFLISIISLAVILITSCSTSESDRIAAGIIPVRNITVSNLDPSRYQIIGNVTGRGFYSVETQTTEDTEYNSGKIGVMTENEIIYLDDPHVSWSSDPFQMALNKAVYEMQEKAIKLGAHFLTFPSYSTEISEDGVVVNVRAAAVMLLDNEGYPLATY